jgi:HK97 family phage prohead protease
MNFRQRIRYARLLEPGIEASGKAQETLSVPFVQLDGTSNGLLMTRRQEPAAPILGQVKSVQLPLEFKATDPERRISGYASRNTVDRMREIVEPTAFTDTVSQFMQNPVMLWMHDMRRVIGKWDRAEIRTDGLWLSGVVASDTPDADMVWALIVQGMLKALSIGFREIDGAMDDAANVYHITQLELYETSIVSVPMNREALFQMGDGKLLSIELLPESVEAAEDQALLEELERRRSAQIPSMATQPVEEEVRQVHPLVWRTWQTGTCAQCDVESVPVLPFAVSGETEWALCTRCFLPEDAMKDWEDRFQKLERRWAELDAPLSQVQRAVTALISREVHRRAADLGIAADSLRFLVPNGAGKPVIPAAGANGGSK